MLRFSQCFSNFKATLSWWIWETRWNCFKHQSVANSALNGIWNWCRKTNELLPWIFCDGKIRLPEGVAFSHFPRKSLILKILQVFVLTGDEDPILKHTPYRSGRKQDAEWEGCWRKLDDHIGDGIVGGFVLLERESWSSTWYFDFFRSVIPPEVLPDGRRNNIWVIYRNCDENVPSQGERGEIVPTEKISFLNRRVSFHVFSSRHTLLQK